VSAPAAPSAGDRIQDHGPGGEVLEPGWHPPMALPPTEGGGPLAAASLPTNRTEFPSRAEAWERATELVRGIVNGEPELFEEGDVHGAPEEQGRVHYLRRRGSTADLQGSRVRGNVVAIVEHVADPTQPPHFHVVRPPPKSPRIEHGGEYRNEFEGTPDEHLTVRDPATAAAAARAAAAAEAAAKASKE